MLVKIWVEKSLGQNKNFGPKDFFGPESYQAEHLRT